MSEAVSATTAVGEMEVGGLAVAGEGRLLVDIVYGGGAYGRQGIEERFLSHLDFYPLARTVIPH